MAAARCSHCSLTTGTETVLHSFGGGTDGNTPVASLINVKGTLVQHNGLGAAPMARHGVLGQPEDRRGDGAFTRSGSGTDGEYPEASLNRCEGWLYGTTEVGGTYGSGRWFALRKP